MTSNALELLIGPHRMRAAAPEAALIADSLHALGRGEIPWVTLSWGISEYVNAFPHPNGGFEVQWEYGTRDNHVRPKGGGVRLEVVLRVFEKFALKAPDWNTECEWERVPLREIDFRMAPDTVQGIFLTG